MKLNQHTILIGLVSLVSLMVIRLGLGYLAQPNPNRYELLANGKFDRANGELYMLTHEGWEKVRPAAPTPTPYTAYTAADYGMSPQEYDNAVKTLPPGFVLDPPAK